MLVVRAKLVTKEDKREEFLAAITKLVHSSRETDGVISYDICEAVTEPNTFIATVQFENEDAMNRQGEKAWTPVSSTIKTPWLAPSKALNSTSPVPNHLRHEPNERYTAHS